MIGLARTVLFYLRLAKFTSIPSHQKKISALPDEKKVHGFIEFYNAICRRFKFFSKYVLVYLYLIIKR
jgi:hypothetical protein